MGRRKPNERIPGWVKRAERSPVSLAGSLSRDGGKTIKVTITDVSAAGCKVTADETLRIGELVRLELPDRGALDASVRWALLGKAGLLFL